MSVSPFILSSSGGHNGAENWIRAPATHFPMVTGFAQISLLFLAMLFSEIRSCYQLAIGKLFAIPLKGNLAVLHDVSPVSNLEGYTDVLFYEQNRQTLLTEGFNRLENLLND